MREVKKLSREASVLRTQAEQATGYERVTLFRRAQKLDTKAQAASLELDAACKAFQEALIKSQR